MLNDAFSRSERVLLAICSGKALADPPDAPQNRVRRGDVLNFGEKAFQRTNVAQEAQNRKRVIEVLSKQSWNGPFSDRRYRGRRAQCRISG